MADITTQQRPFNYELNGYVPHTTEYRTNLEHARHSGFQTLDVEHRTDSRHPLDQPPGTTMETDKDGGRRRRRQTEADEDRDRRRRRQTKMEPVEDDDRLAVGTRELPAALQLTTPQSEHIA